MKIQPDAMRIRTYALVLALMLILSACDQYAWQSVPSSASTNTRAPNQSFPMSADGFQNQYHVTLDWSPSEILDYADDYAKISGSMDNNIKWYITQVNDGSVEVNEVEWVLDESRPNGFRLDDVSPQAKTHSLTDDTGIWLLIDSSQFYRIPVSDLQTYLGTELGRQTLWNFKLQDGVIMLLAQQYMP